MGVGDSVRAAAVITEEDFNGKAIHVHARIDDLGIIRGIDGEWLNVTWSPSGTTTECHESEIELRADHSAAVH